MALTALTEGFDSYTVIAQKWSGLSGGSTAIQTSTGRTGANFLKSFQARRAFAARHSDRDRARHVGGGLPDLESVVSHPG
jgi:hypothetical protein